MPDANTDPPNGFKRIDRPGVAPAHPCVLLGVGMGREAASYEATAPLPEAGYRVCVFLRSETEPADAPPLVAALHRGDWDAMVRLGQAAWAEIDDATAAN